MGLTLLVGPANAGKVALLLDRYLAVAEREPVLIVPNRSDVERVERDLLKRAPVLLGGSIGTFDDLFDDLARGGAPRPVLTDTQRGLLIRRVAATVPANGLSASARSAGFPDALASAISDLEAGLVEPGAVDGHVADFYRAYAADLDRLGVWDADLKRVYAAERAAGDLSAWDGRPVFAYGFEDLTAAEWRLLEALAGRADVTVSLPYEPGRPAFAALERTAGDLARLASGHIEELPPRYAEYAPPALAHLERALFSDAGLTDSPPIAGAVRWLEGAGGRATLELVAEEILALVRDGTPPEAIGVVCPSLERLRGPVDTAFSGFGLPYAIEGRVRLGQTAFGHALLSLLAFAWRGGGRRELYAFLGSPYSGLARSHVDFLEGRLRGRAIDGHDRVEAETERLRGAPISPLETLRAAPSAAEAVRRTAASMLRAAHGLDAPPATEAARLDLRAYEAAVETARQLDAWSALSGTELSREDAVAALERATVRLSRAAEPGRVAVLDLLRARTRRFDVVFLLGLEEGTFPRRGDPSPFLDDQRRRELEPQARLARPDAATRDRYLFYTACTRPRRRLVLVREAATDDGSPREPSPFWEETRAVFAPDEVERATRRRRLSELTWRVDAAPTERERLRALAELSSRDEDRPLADALAAANGWARQLTRARRAFARPTALRHPAVLQQLAARLTFPVTELERFADCSSAWFVERLIDPKTIDAEVDAKLRGSVAHTALHRFFTGLPRELGTDHVDAERVEDAVRFMRRCLDQALEGVRMEMTAIQRAELDQTLWRDLEQLVRDEASSASALVPRRFEVLFGTDRAAPELQRGLELGEGLMLSGKIDRIDVDPFSARGIVQDYKAGKGAHSARDIERELRLQIPLYMLVLRDLVGIEPLGGLYRPVAGDRQARGLLRAAAEGDVLAGYVGTDYLADDDFWGQVENARSLAREFAQRIGRGDVRHDPKGGECPPWCDLWPMCRVRRP